MATKRKDKSTQMPELIPDTPENIMRAVLSTPPKKAAEWKFMQEEKRRKESIGNSTG